jgi:hypothetical protein
MQTFLKKTTNEKAATSPTKKAKSPKKEAPETKLPVTTVGRRWRATTIGIGTPGNGIKFQKTFIKKIMIN